VSRREFDKFGRLLLRSICLLEFLDDILQVRHPPCSLSPLRVCLGRPFVGSHLGVGIATGSATTFLNMESAAAAATADGVALVVARTKGRSSSTHREGRPNRRQTVSS
jgi:hypothetical protein